MAQAQIETRQRQNAFFFDLDGQLMVKIWKRQRQGVFVTLKNTGTTQSDCTLTCIL